MHLAVATSTRRRAEVPGSLHEQDLGLEACRGPLGRLQPSVGNGGHVVLEPWLIGDVVHHRHFLHTKQKVESCPKVIRDAISKEEAERSRLEERKEKQGLRLYVLIGEELEGEVLWAPCDDNHNYMKTSGQTCRGSATRFQTCWLPKIRCILLLVLLNLLSCFPSSSSTFDHHEQMVGTQTGDQGHGTTKRL